MDKQREMFEAWFKSQQLEKEDWFARDEHDKD